MNGEVELYQGSSIPDIFVARDPVVVIAEARKAAQVLVSVVSQKPKKVMMNGEQYLEFEDWQTVGKFYGCTVKVRSTTFIDYGGVKGFEAVADVLDRDGRVISSADAMCLNDEDKWSTRTKYEYKDVLVDGKRVWVEGTGGKKGYYKSEKVAAGEVAVPLFQLRSMAQTRACAKAFRNVFSWVVVLAGYKPTVAEELDETQGKEEKENVKPPQEKSSGERHEIKDPNAPASEPQIKALSAMMGKLGVKDADRHNWAASMLGLQTPPESIKVLTKGQASSLIELMQKMLDEKAAANA